jgi:hypothetical protein
MTPMIAALAQAHGVTLTGLGVISCLARYDEPPNKQLQRTVMDNVPSHIGQRAAELRRYALVRVIACCRR